MKNLKKYKLVTGILLTVVLASYVTVACGKNELQIDEEYDITESSVAYETLSPSNASKFAYEDLIVNKVRFGMTEEEVIAVLGEPANIYDSQEVKQNPTLSSTASTKEADKKADQQDISVSDKKSNEQANKEASTSVAGGKDQSELLDEKIYGYNDLSLIFMPIDGIYKLCAAASTSDTDVFSRGLKVGDSKDKILEMYYRDVDCLNNNLMTEDNATIIGKYLYGGYTLDKLETIKTHDKIEYGVINYNGNNKMEDTECIIEFTYFEPPYISDGASVNDDFAQISFDIDEQNMIAGIRWYYYPEVK